MYRRLVATLGNSEDERRTRAWMTFAAYTARRRSALARLRAADFDRRGAAVWYHYVEKGKKEDWRELPGPVVDALLAWRPDAIEADHGGNICGCTADALENRLKRAARAAGLDARRVTIHGLRHLAAELQEAAGASIEEIRDFLGHEDIGTTLIYMKALKDDKRAARVDEISRRLED